MNVFKQKSVITINIVSVLDTFDKLCCYKLISMYMYKM